MGVVEGSVLVCLKKRLAEESLFSHLPATLPRPETGEELCTLLKMVKIPADHIPLQFTGLKVGPSCAPIIRCVVIFLFFFLGSHEREINITNLAIDITDETSVKPPEVTGNVRINI